MGELPVAKHDAISRYDILAAGKVVRGLAHDLNNHLGVILAYAELMRLDAEDGSESVNCSDGLLGVVAALVSDEECFVERVELAELVRHIGALLNHRCRDGNIRFVVRTPDTPLHLNAARSRVVRGLIHVGDWLLEGMQSGTPPEALRLEMVASAHRCDMRWEVEGCVLGDDPFESPDDRLALAQEHFRYHRGDIVRESPTALVCQLPIDAGLTLPEGG